MKKLSMALAIALFASNAFANVRIDETQYGAGADGSMRFDLAINSTFVYKLLNDKADGDAGAAGQQEAQDSVIDLGQITAGIPAAGNSNDCADLAGLTQAAALGVAAQANEVETGIPVVADTASCYVHKAGSNIDLRMAIPLRSILSKSGAGTLDISYAEAAPTADSFQSFEICEGLAGAPSLSGVSIPACAQVKQNVVAAAHGHTQAMHVRLEARLAGAGSKANYADVLEVDIVDTP